LKNLRCETEFQFYKQHSYVDLKSLTSSKMRNGSRKSPELIDKWIEMIWSLKERDRLAYLQMPGDHKEFYSERYLSA
jgi:hypothetical protein